MSAKTAVTLNALALYAISGILLAAFYWQLATGELPCPLCLLERLALFTYPIFLIFIGAAFFGMRLTAAGIVAAVLSNNIVI
jgi:disulfide bond formation protein DsbB